MKTNKSTFKTKQNKNIHVTNNQQYTNTINETNPCCNLKWSWKLNCCGDILWPLFNGWKGDLRILQDLRDTSTENGQSEGYCLILDTTSQFETASLWPCFWRAMPRAIPIRPILFLTCNIKSNQDPDYYCLNKWNWYSVTSEKNHQTESSSWLPNTVTLSTHRKSPKEPSDHQD